MDVSKPHLLFGTVAHGRLFPRRNSFHYGIYYLAFPLSQIRSLPLAYNRWAPLGFHDRDHGACDGSDLKEWASSILEDYRIKEADGEMILICMPRIFGYVFNPVSFWLCHDKQGDLRAVLCEVHNTFGERHVYLCAHDDHRGIAFDDTLKGEKLFHVSPFLKRAGHYTFRFDTRENKFAVWIDFFDSKGKKQLVTSLVGKCAPMNRKNLRKAFWRYPLVTFKAIALIHWQALKLLTKGIQYVSRPKQKTQRISTTD